MSKNSSRRSSVNSISRRHSNSKTVYVSNSKLKDGNNFDCDDEDFTDFNFKVGGCRNYWKICRRLHNFSLQMPETRNSSGRNQSSNENNRLKKNKAFNIIKQEIEEKSRRFNSKNQV